MATAFPCDGGLVPAIHVKFLPAAARIKDVDVRDERRHVGSFLE